MRTNKLVALAAGLAVMMAVAAAPSCKRRGARPAPGTLRFNISSEPPSLDWSIATDHSSIQVLQNIMEGLTRFDEDLKVQPALAESWEVSDDGLTYTFHLRTDVRWTDGRPVTADDFVYSWRRLLDPETAGEYAYFIHMVKNAKPFNIGELKDPKKVGVRARGDHVLEVELERPVVFFPMITTFISTFPMRGDVVETHGDNWTEPENIITCGPYRIVEWRHEYRIQLERNPIWHGGRAGLDRVIFYMVNEESTALSLYLTGGIDVIDTMPPPSIPTYETHPDYKSYPYFAIYYYGFNVTRPPVDNPKVRAALAHGLDRERLPEILKGHQIPYASAIPFGMEGTNQSIGRHFDSKRAKELLAEAGYSDPKKLPPITIGYNTLESHKMIAEFVQQQWKEHLGIDVRLRNMEWKVYLKELQHDPPHVWRLGWILDYPAPDAIMTVWLSDSGNNHTRWKSETYDQLVRAAAVEKNPDKRLELYNRAQKLLLEQDTAIMPLYSYAKNIMIRPWVRNFPMNGQDLLHLRETFIEVEAK